MALNILADLKQRQEHWVDNLVRSLSDSDATLDHLYIKPVDAWPGDAEKGLEIYNHPQVLNPQNWPESWHHFSFLRDFRAMGTEGRLMGQDMIGAWLAVYAIKKTAKDIRIFIDGEMGQRLYHWLAHYEFFVAEADEDLHDYFFESLWEQSRFLWAYAIKKTPPKVQGYGYIQALKGAVVSLLALENKPEHLDILTQRFEGALQAQILDDGTHISRAPFKLLYSLKSLLEIRTALHAGAHHVPEYFDVYAPKMVSALKTMRHHDGCFMTLQGAQEGCAEAIDCITAQSGLKARSLKSLPRAGFDKVSQGRTALLIDHGNMPPAPYDRGAHLSPLAFEMSHGKERLIVSCGSAKNDPAWVGALRTSPAHSMLVLNNQDAYILGEEKRTPEFGREDANKAALLQGTHFGYLQRFGVIHTRRLFLSHQGLDLRGEDFLDAAQSTQDYHHIAIRFHLHPRVIVSLVRGGEEALLRLPSGIGWRFHQEGGTLALEESVYLGESDAPRKTSQLVIYANLEGKSGLVKWALQAEGLIKKSASAGDRAIKNHHGETPTLL